MGCNNQNNAKEALSQGIRSILDLSFKYCKSDNADLALLAQQINAKAFQVMKIIDRSGGNCCAVTSDEGCNGSCNGSCNAG